MPTPASRRRRRDPRYHYFSYRVPHNLVARLDDAKWRLRTSRNELITRALREFLATQPEGVPPLEPATAAPPDSPAA
jgi:hypothetical protein